MDTSTLEFLSSVRSLNIRLSCQGGQLRYSAPPGVITPELRQELTARKGEILAFFREANKATVADPIQPISREGELPLSFPQSRLWLMNQFQPESFAYNIPSYFCLRGDLNREALEASFNEIVRRHEVLRTRFLQKNGQPSIEIVEPQPFHIGVIDLQQLSGEEQRKEVLRLAQDDARQPFDLSHTPMLRATLLRFAERDHLLLLTLAHIAFDGWSFGILTKELSQLYSAFVQELPSPLAELKLQYQDFAAWQQNELQGDLLQSQMKYWRENLSGNLPALELATDRPRAAMQTANGGSVFFEIPTSLTNDLKTLSRKEDVTLFVTLLTAFNTLLMRYSGQEDMLVGTPIANRNRREVEDLIGFFVNTVVMRTDLSGNPSFRTLMRRVQEVAARAYANQDVPFEKLVEALNPGRDVSRSPIFQVMFSLEHSPVTPLTMPGLEPTWVEMQNTGSQFDLVLYLTETNNHLVGRFSFNSDLFDQQTVERLAGHYQTLLSEVLRDAGQGIAEIPFLTQDERENLLHGRNQTRASFPESLGVHQLFEERARQTPDAIAVECGGERLSYRELDERSNQLAGNLQALGVQPGNVVAVCVERSVGLAAALLGVLKTGASYLPLDLAFPAERLAFMLEDAQPAALLTQTDLLDKLPSHTLPVVCLDHLSLHRERLDQPSANAGRAYLLYTSGSTGKPKGVEISHRALVNFLASMRANPGMEPHDVLLSVTTISFDIFGLELWLPLTTGAKVVIASAETSKDGKQLARAISSSGATIMQATPTTWRLLLESDWQGSPQLKILCGGEAWPKDLAARLLPKCASLWNMYGPTETTIWSAVSRVAMDSNVEVGPPIANTQFYVVDSRLQLQPLGIPGELLIGGEGLAEGYLHRPELTAEKFIRNPFDRNVDSQARVYRTGDLVRALPNGNFEFISRMDHQVKLRGFRIELGEIEALLRTAPQVEEAVVALRQDGNPQLAAFCVLTEANAIDGTDLRRLLKSRLPDYMIPAEFMFLADLPLTPNGKIDRKALLALPRAPRAQTATAVCGPRDHLERQLTTLFERILHVHPVHTTDNFFDLGGHSFAAVRLLAEIQRLTGKNLPLATLFQAATIESLADVLRSGETPSWSLLVPIQAGGSKPPLFLVHGAEGNLLLYRQFVRYLGPEQPVYGLQSQGLDGGEAFLETVQDMARAYIKEILAVQSEGPYLLGGYCLGGVIALEMAQQLTAAGKQVELVAMLESYNSAAFRSPGYPLGILHWLQNIWFHLANVAMLPSKDRRKFLGEKFDIARTRMRIRLRALAYRFQKKADAQKIHRIYPHLLVKTVNDRAAFRYVPSSYEGRVAVIGPKRFFKGMEGSTLGWSEVVREGLEVHEVAVYPKGMLVEPFCGELAGVVKRCLAEIPAGQEALS